MGDFSRMVLSSPLSQGLSNADILKLEYMAGHLKGDADELPLAIWGASDMMAAFCCNIRVKCAIFAFNDKNRLLELQYYSNGTAGASEIGSVLNTQISLIDYVGFFSRDRVLIGYKSSHFFLIRYDI